jgi:kinetochore protein Mis13/DSN1
MRALLTCADMARLRIEKAALEACLQTPSLPQDKRPDDQIDRSLLTAVEMEALDSIQSSTTTSTEHISRQVNEILESIGPTIDQFADGMHRIGQYRIAADNFAGRTLAICAQKLTDRDKQGRKKALLSGEGAKQNTPPKDLGGVLRSLSRADR